LQAYGGVMTMTGRPEDPPTFCGPAINDVSTGMWCVIGALGAIQQRHTTGRGCVIDCSLFESAVSWVGGAVNGYLHNGNVPKRHGTGSNLLVPYQVFETADRPICIAAGNDRLWARCAKVLGRDEWATDPKFAKSAQRVAHKAELLPMIAEALKAKPRAEWLELMEKAGVPCAAVNDIGELARTEQMEASKLIQQLPGGPKVVGLPIAFDHVRPHSARSAPTLGEHTDEVLGSLPK
jgi:crotonobetainyl-CoA:carnitine CoA-transferase CaiB-like acyl-CoA transferase